MKEKFLKAMETIFKGDKKIVCANDVFLKYNKDEEVIEVGTLYGYDITYIDYEDFKLINN